MKKASFFIIIFIYYSFCFSQTETKVDLSNPNATIYTHLYFLQKKSYQPKKAAKTIYGLKDDEAIDKAIKLKKILDGKGLKVNFTKIPTDKNFNDTTAYKIGHRYVLFPVRLPQVSVEKYGDKWLYSRETVLIIDDLYKETFPWQIAWLQKAIPKYGNHTIFGIKLWQYLGLIGLVIFGFIFSFIFNKILYFILKKLQHLLTKNSSEKVLKTIKKISRPLVLLILIWIIKRITPTLQLGLTVNEFLFIGFNAAQILLWIFIFLKLVKLAMIFYAEHTKRTHIKLDDQLVPILTHFLTGIVIFLGILKLLTLFGVSATSVLAGASIGGLALALASQDTVKNLIGTFMIFLDKPFHIGDWIETDELQGTVEQVGFRSSRIRAADTSIYQITNSKLSEIVINNKGLRLFRRYQTELGIRYDTPPELIEIFIDGLKELIKSHPNTKKDSFDVAFSGFGDSALNIMLNIYFNVNDWSTEQQAKHQLHLSIVKLASIIGIDFAFPSTTVMIEQFPEKKSIEINYQKEIENIKKEINLLTKELKNSNTNTTSKITQNDED